MNYLYHLVPRNFKGNVLMPLNSMRKKYPSVYKDEVKKYNGRESLLKVKIPILDCFWNDVLHFTAVNPRKFKKELVEAGMPKEIKMKWFQINPKDLDKDSMIVYLYTEKIKEWNIKKREYTKFDSKKLPKYDKIPTKTKKYFKECYKQGKRPLMFHLIPHILYKGRINIKNCGFIEV